MNLRIAIAHDYLTQRGGAERVVLTLAERFPDAPIYTTLYDPAATYPGFSHLDVRPSRLNSIRLLRRHHRWALPLLPFASRSIRIDADVVIASSSGWAHAFGGSHRKLVYCYSPARWLYAADQYFPSQGSGPMRVVLKFLGRHLRRWDRAAAAQADRYIAISSVVQERIRLVYGIEATILAAPLSTDLSSLDRTAVDEVADPGYILCVSRLLPYKNVDKIVDAFKLLPDERLVVVGRGPEGERLQAQAPENVVFLRDLTDGQIAGLYANAAGLVAASFEDFGLTPLEAAVFGKPSAVLRAGGFLDTMIEDHTAKFFDTPDARSIADAITKLLETPWSNELIVEHSQKFAADVFLDHIEEAIAELVSTNGSTLK